MLEPVRLLSPNRRRIAQYSPIGPGAKVLAQLRSLDWINYTGPAETVNGFIIPGTDPLVDLETVPYEYKP